MRVGPRFNTACVNLSTVGGHLLAYVGICRFSAFTFQVLELLNGFDRCKASDYRSFITVLVVVIRRSNCSIIIIKMSACLVRSWLLSNKRHWSTLIWAPSNYNIYENVQY